MKLLKLEIGDLPKETIGTMKKQEVFLKQNSELLQTGFTETIKGNTD